MSQTNTSLLCEVVQWSQETCRQELKSVLPKLTSLHFDSDSWDDHIRIQKIITDLFLPHIGLSELEDECFSKILPKETDILARRFGENLTTTKPSKIKDYHCNSLLLAAYILKRCPELLRGGNKRSHDLLVLSRTAKMFNSMMQEITNQVGGLSSQNTELCALLRNILQGMMQLIDTLFACVRHVGSFEEAPDLDAIRSLPTCILKVLRDTFQHCKDSEVVYCGRLSLVADLLQGLFKEAYSLQKGLLELLDKISLDSRASEEVVFDVVTEEKMLQSVVIRAQKNIGCPLFSLYSPHVIHSLLDICSVISSLDMALHANTWKFLIKQSLKYQSLVEEHLHHGDIVSSLCDNLVASFHNCMELAGQIKQADLQESTQIPEYKLFQKTAKMCRFFANTLVHYIKEFKYFLTKYCSNFLRLYLQLVSEFPPSLSAPVLPAALSGELNAAALVPMNAFLLQLLPLRPFAEAVLQPDLLLSPEQELPLCVLLVSVLGHLADQPEDVQQLWYSGSQFSEDSPRLPLYKAIFSSFRRCYTERKVPVLLPGVMLKGQAQVQVTLHHHICVQLCASVAVLPPAFFPVLEHCLVDAVLQADTPTALLATDVWCFTSRYGTAELCLHHVHLIAQMVKACTAEGYQLFHLGLLLKRMVFLMTPIHQMELVARFPPSEVENLPVWHHVLFRALSQDTYLHVQAEIIGLTQKVLTDWQDGGYKLGQMDKVNAVLLSLLSVLRGHPSPGEQCVLSAVKIITQLWSRMSPDQMQSQPALQHTLQLLLSTTAILVKNAEPRVICQAAFCVDAVVSQKCADHLLLAALEFLSSLGKIFIPLDNQGQLVPRLSSLFRVLLADKSWLIQQHALEAFSYFAENTNHEEVISQSLCVEETKTKVVNYLSKTLNIQEDAESRLLRLKEEAAVIKEHNKIQESKETVSNKQAAEAEVLTNSEPCPKKARQDASTEEEYSCYIQTAQSALKALQALKEGNTSRTETPPAWLEDKLQELLVLITSISSVKPTT